MAEEENPFARFKPVPINGNGLRGVQTGGLDDEENPFLKFKPQRISPVEEPVDQEPLQNRPGTDYRLPGDPETFPEPAPKVNFNTVSSTPEQAQSDMNAINEMRSQGEFEGVAVPDDSTVQSFSDIYGDVDNQEKYKGVKDYENSIMGTLFGDNGVLGIGGMPEDLKKLKSERDLDRWVKYYQTGEEQSLFGIPIRVQEQKVNNPDFAPGNGQEPYLSNRYIVDPPDADTLQRMAYQVLENVGGGIADFVGEGKLSKEGTVGQYLPDTVPDHNGEKLATDIATFAIGNAGMEKAIGSGAGLAGRLFSRISPEAKTSIREAYAQTFRLTGDAKLAKESADLTARSVITGAGLGIKVPPIAKTLGKMAAVGTAEAAVAPDNSEGAYFSPDYLKKTFNLSDERAKDMSFLLDSPAISGTLATFGAISKTVTGKFIEPALGGIREWKPLGIPFSKLPLTDKQAGISMMAWLDPNLTKSSPEEAIHKMKLLGDAVKRNGVKNLQLMSASKGVKLDTATSFNELAKDYFSAAYINRKNLMEKQEPGSFDKWVNTQAQEAAGKLTKLRTSMGADGTASLAVGDIQALMGEAAEGVNPGGLGAAQSQAGKLAGETNIEDRTLPDVAVNQTKQELDAAKAAQDTAMTDDPDFNKFLSTANNDLGSTTNQQKLVDKIGQKSYDALKKMKTESDDAYKAIANIEGEGDPVSFLEIIKDSPHTQMRAESGKPLGTIEQGPSAPSYDITDPFLKKIADSIEADPSAGNIYNKIRTQINEQINALSANDTSGKLPTLYKLRDNINNEQLNAIAENGDDNIKQLVADAKTKYIDLQNAWHGANNQSLRTIADKGELAIKTEGNPIPKGMDDFKIGVSHYVNNNLNTNEREIYRNALENAAKAGGQDITPDLHEFFASKAVNNLADTLARGGKQNVGTLRGDLRGIIENLEGMKSPLVNEFKKMGLKIQTLENTTKDKQEIYNSIKEQAAELKGKAEDSILARFVTKSANGLVPIEGGDVGKTLNTIFQGKNSVTNVKQLLDEADKIPGGQVIKDAAQGSYIRYLQNKITSGSKMDMIPPEQRFAKRANERNIEKTFDDDAGNDYQTMKEVFRDKPEVVQALEKVADVYDNVSKKTPMTDQKELLGALPRGQDPAQAAQTIITFFFGQLNPTATKIKRFTTPASIEMLDDVKARRADFMMNAVEDVDFLAKKINQISDSELDKQFRQFVNKSVRRGAYRSYMSNKDRGVRATAVETERLLREARDAAEGYIK
ncbi:hypothetical protein F67_I3_11_085 [Rhizobium phage RHph_I3_11]|nr:hypothetical protein F67_I3_11_085 [Rhizobium phage RHph_I3_11]